MKPDLQFLQFKEAWQGPRFVTINWQFIAYARLTNERQPTGHWTQTVLDLVSAGF